MSARPIGEDDLGGWVDGRLAPDRRDAVAAFLAERPDLAETLDADRALALALRERLAAKSAEPIPPRLRIASVQAHRRARFWRRSAWAAAACLWLGLGGALGWAAHDLVPAAPGAPWAATARDALAAHRTFTVETVHPVEVGADQETHLTQWLSRRLGRPLVIPDLAAEGLRLVGGRVLPAEGGVAALLMYAEPGGARVTVYVGSGTAADVAPAPRFHEKDEGAVRTLVWSEAGAAYAVSAALPADRLLGIARAIAGGRPERPRGQDL